MSLSKQASFIDQSPKVAYEFFDILYEREKALTKSPANIKKSKVLVGSGENEDLVTAQQGAEGGHDDPARVVSLIVILLLYFSGFLLISCYLANRLIKVILTSMSMYSPVAVLLTNEGLFRLEPRGTFQGRNHNKMVCFFLMKILRGNIFAPAKSCYILKG